MSRLRGFDYLYPSGERWSVSCQEHCNPPRELRVRSLPGRRRPLTPICPRTLPRRGPCESQRISVSRQLGRDHRGRNRHRLDHSIANRNRRVPFVVRSVGCRSSMPPHGPTRMPPRSRSLRYSPPLLRGLGPVVTHRTCWERIRDMSRRDRRLPKARPVDVPQPQSHVAFGNYRSPKARVSAMHARPVSRLLQRESIRGESTATSAFSARIFATRSAHVGSGLR